MAYTPGNGSVLQLSISAVFTTIAQELSFGGLSRKRTPIDVTGLGDTFEVQKAGLRRADPLPFAAWWDPANAVHQQLLTSYTNATDESWKIVEADAGAATVTFTGWLEDLTIGEQTVDGYVQITGQIRLTSDITVTP